MPIYSAQPNDAQDIAYILEQTRLATYPNAKYDISPNDLKQHFEHKRKTWWVKRLEKRLSSQDPSRFHLVYKIGKKPVAYAGWYWHKPQKWSHTLGALYVLPQYQNQWIGSKLLNYILDKLQPWEKIIVEIATYNIPAIHFYQKHWFKKIPAKTGNYKLHSGKALPTIFMEKFI